MTSAKAKPRSKTKRKLPNEVEKDLPNLPFSIRSIKLYFFDLTLHTGVELEAREDAKIDYRISAAIHDVEVDKDDCIFFTNYTIAKFIDDECAGIIEAKYITALDGIFTLDDWLPYVHIMASATIWQKFVDLCSLAMLQANLTWPSLPLNPPGIYWKPNTITKQQRAEDDARFLKAD